MMATIREKLQVWWNGRFIPYENNPSSGVFFIGGDYEWHWTARAARAVAFFLQREWKWMIGTALAVAGLLVAYLRLP